MAFVRVLAADALQPGEMRRVDVGGRAVAVARLDDGYYAFDDTCSHMQESLSEGYLDDHCVYCPLHQSAFDLRTGEVQNPPATEPIRTYAVKVEDGGVWVDVERPRAEAAASA